MRRNATTNTTRGAVTGRAPHSRCAIRGVLMMTTPDSTPELLPCPRTHTRFLPLYECTLSAGLGSRLLGENAIEIGHSSSVAELKRSLNGALLNKKCSCDFRTATSSHRRPQTRAKLEPAGELALVGGVQLCEELHIAVEPVASARPAVAAIACLSYGG